MTFTEFVVIRKTELSKTQLNKLELDLAIAFEPACLAIDSSGSFRRFSTDRKYLADEMRGFVLGWLARAAGE